MADPRAVPISWIRRRSTAQGLALRVHTVLACAKPGTINAAIVTQLGISNLTVGKW